MCSGRSPKVTVESVYLGDVLDRLSAERLASCQFYKLVSFSRECSPNVYCSWGMCGLDRGHCGSCGKRLRFKLCFDGFHVVWVCDKLVGLPDLEV